MTLLVPLAADPETFEVIKPEDFTAPFNPPDAIVTLEIPVNAPTRLLFCDDCKAWTVHTLNRAGGWKYYMCDCGTGIMYIIVRSENR